MAHPFPLPAHEMQKLIKATPNPRRRNSCPLPHTALQSSCWRPFLIPVPKCCGNAYVDFDFDVKLMLLKAEVRMNFQTPVEQSRSKKRRVSAGHWPTESHRGLPCRNEVVVASRMVRRRDPVPCVRREAVAPCAQKGAESKELLRLPSSHELASPERS